MLKQLESGHRYEQLGLRSVDATRPHDGHDYLWHREFERELAGIVNRNRAASDSSNLVLPPVLSSPFYGVPSQDGTIISEIAAKGCIFRFRSVLV